MSCGRTARSSAWTRRPRSARRTRSPLRSSGCDDEHDDQHADRADVGRRPMTPPLQPERAPRWMRTLLDSLHAAEPASLSGHELPAPAGARRSAVLILLADDDAHGPDVLLTERASTLRAHAGQVSFPGGSTDPDDVD